MLRAKAMGFKSVRRVEVKAETTTPGEVRTTTDANGVRVSTSRARRTLPKLEFVVEENGAILHGPQRGHYPYYHYPHADTMTATSAAMGTTHVGDDDDDGSGGVMPLARSDLHPDEMQFRAFPSRTNQEETAPSTYGYSMSGSAVPMKDCVLNDTRATTLALKYDHGVGKFVCGSSIERFSGHTGVCRVLGSKKYPIIPHNLQIGDLLRIGSVGLVVCEMNRTPSDETVEALTDDEYQYIRDNYLSAPLQQSFRPNEPRSNNEEEEEEEEEEEMERRRSKKGRAGETSDEGESEEDGQKRESGEEHHDDDDDEADHDDEYARDGRGRGMKSKSKQRALGAAAREKRFCYICYDDDEDNAQENPLVAPCNCKGDTKYVHLECLQRWNNNTDQDGANPNHKVCAITNTDGLDVCSICKATYLTSVRLDDGRVVSLMAKKLPPPYVTFAVVTQHEARSRSTTLTNTRFQLSFANIPRGQEFLTIGRSTTNNMTLRYRTVSQLHAKIKYENNTFQILDASSSNGTMLFLSKPLELDWNKTMHVKIGRTILTLKSKKRWKWTGGSDSDEESDPPTPRAMESNQSTHSTNRFDDDPPRTGPLHDPSFDLLTSTSYAATLRQPLARTFASPYPSSSPHQLNRASTTHSDFDGLLDRTRLSDLDNITREHRESLSRDSFGTPRSSTSTTERVIPRLSSRYAERRDQNSPQLRPSFNYIDRLSQMSIGSPQYSEGYSARDQFDGV